MNSRLVISCKRLTEDVGHIEHHLHKVGEQIKSATDKSIEALEVDLVDAQEKCEERKSQASDALQRMGKFIEEAKDSAVTRFEDWRVDRQIEKIEKEADKKEQQAIDAILVAAHACMEAEVAIIDALKTRKMADEVAG